MNVIIERLTRVTVIGGQQEHKEILDYANELTGGRQIISGESGPPNTGNLTRDMDKYHCSKIVLDNIVVVD